MICSRFVFYYKKNILTVNANIFNFYFILLNYIVYKDNSYLRIQTVFVYNSTCKIKNIYITDLNIFAIKNGDKVLDVTIASMIVIPKKYLQGIYDITVKHYSRNPKRCYIIVKYTDDNIFNLKNINFDSNDIVEKNNSIGIIKRLMSRITDIKIKN